MSAISKMVSIVPNFTYLYFSLLCVSYQISLKGRLKKFAWDAVYELVMLSLSNQTFFLQFYFLIHCGKYYAKKYGSRDIIIFGGEKLHEMPFMLKIPHCFFKSDFACLKMFFNQKSEFETLLYYENRTKSSKSMKNDINAI